MRFTADKLAAIEVNDGSAERVTGAAIRKEQAPRGQRLTISLLHHVARGILQFKRFERLSHAAPDGTQPMRVRAAPVGKSRDADQWFRRSSDRGCRRLITQR